MMAEYERTKNPVPDNTPADWEAPAVQWARDNGLLVGDGSGNLMLHSNMTRAQFLVMLKKYHKKKSEIRRGCKGKILFNHHFHHPDAQKRSVLHFFFQFTRKEKTPKVLENQGFRGFFEWCARRESNPHALASTGT